MPGQGTNNGNLLHLQASMAKGELRVNAGVRDGCQPAALAGQIFMAHLCRTVSAMPAMALEFGWPRKVSRHHNESDGRTVRACQILISARSVADPPLPDLTAW